MTEKEFFARIDEETRSAWRAGRGAGLAKAVLALAKQAGARFDPEPAKLPELQVLRLAGLSWAPSPVDGVEKTWFTEAEAAEVVRRCNAWEEIRAFVDRLGAEGPKWLSTEDVRRRRHLLEILDGA